ncbi:trypsin-like peptidase domain-containing protein [Microbulbifer elongatus]|uniref:Trypsin-like peptidase domain-containing protein n=1 Tax=Microbulbifer elongatus TaxID=86173 RepID=A0ABT1NZW0_9GAMM|nr:serine protease [Microbulbifer elongatus]MCQ3829383.1 trypsin-like peptidase domain-containing protein [Microbulbifer elongatus]
MNNRLFIYLFVITGLLSGCAHTAQKDASQIKATTKLNQEIQLPADLNVGYYVVKSTHRGNMFTEQGLRALANISSKQFDAAIANIFTPYFSQVEPIQNGKHYDLIFKISSDLEITAWPNYIADLSFNVYDMSSENRYAVQAKKSVTSMNMTDKFAIHNAYAAALKEGLFRTLNQLGPEKIFHLTHEKAENPLDLYSDARFINFEKPASTSTGFFINSKGDITTTWHGIKNCKATKVFLNDTSYPANVHKHSLLLDMAILATDHQPRVFAKIAQDKVDASLLGHQILTTGFPLSNVLSGQPNLTVGNLSSIGGLKGRKGQFQITAPIQPGNSGGPVLTLDGTVLGMVTSKMNASDSENLNFASSSRLLKRFYEHNKIDFEQTKIDRKSPDFAKASTESQKFTVQIACYR